MMTKLETGWARASLREVFAEVLRRVDVRSSFRRAESVLDEVGKHVSGLTPRGRAGFRILSIGKAAVPMAEELLQRCGVKRVLGVISTTRSPELNLKGVQVFYGGHPLPNKESILAANAALELLAGADSDDLVLFLISGGGSSLIETPILESIPLEDLRASYHALVNSGANIVEINTVRKHLSRIKGGRLAVAAYPARQITLYVLDVPTGYESFVAAGPSMPDDSTLQDLNVLMERYGFHKTFPASILCALESGSVPETPKRDHPAFERAEWHCLLSSADAMEAARQCAEARGWNCVLETCADEATAGEAAEYLLARLDSLRTAGERLPLCVIADGEVRTSVRGGGVGGRNQAFVLECVHRIQGDKVAVLSAGTDGVDGNSPAAGAVADGTSDARSRLLGMSPRQYLANCDSNTFFAALGDDIVTGPTGTNVRDIRLLLSW